MKRRSFLKALTLSAALLVADLRPDKLLEQLWPRAKRLGTTETITDIQKAYYNTRAWGTKGPIDPEKAYISPDSFRHIYDMLKPIQRFYLNNIDEPNLISRS